MKHVGAQRYSQPRCLLAEPDPARMYQTPSNEQAAWPLKHVGLQHDSMAVDSIPVRACRKIAIFLEGGKRPLRSPGDLSTADLTGVKFQVG